MAQETGKNLPPSPKALRKETVAAHQTAESPWATVSIRACCRVIKENWKAHVQFLAVEPKNYGLNAQPKIDKTETMPDRSNVDVVAIFQRAYRSASLASPRFHDDHLDENISKSKVTVRRVRRISVKEPNISGRRHPERTVESNIHDDVDQEEESLVRRRDYGRIRRLFDPSADIRKLDVASSPSSFRQRNLELKRGLPETSDGLEVSVFADTGPKQPTYGGHYAGIRKWDAAGSPSSFEQGDLKLKRGLLGTIDGFEVSALADTGAALNVVSCNFARARKLDVADSARSFRQGNKTIAHSLGTVNVSWAFADKPTQCIEIVCHVISNCVYDVILGNPFLSMTETFTKYKYRLTKCLSSAARVLRFNLLDGSHQLLEGTLGNKDKVYAVPDTGAEGNVLNLRYAENQNFNIMRGPENRRVLEFADGSRQETVGQVETSWTFDSGQRITLIFEVLEDCIHDVILGEEVVWEHDVFETHAASIQTLPSDTESLDLAPFSFVPQWVQKLSGAMKPFKKSKGRDTKPTDIKTLKSEERSRQNIWHHQYDFWRKADAEEQNAERERRRQYEERLALARLALEGRGSAVPGSYAQRIPSIPNAPNGRTS